MNRKEEQANSCSRTSLRLFAARAAKTLNIIMGVKKMQTESVNPSKHIYESEEVYRSKQQICIQWIRIRATHVTGKLLI